jgi:pimeloyl-[acyl-carrier protein] methyl ester esterase
MAHSYGLHLCPVEQLQQASKIVIFCSFAQFHPTSEPLKRRSQKILQQMIDQFMIDPQRVLCNFQLKCYHPCAGQETCSVNFDANLLLHDLNDLQTAQMDLALLQTIPQILILQGDQDRIVPAASSAELVSQLFMNNSKDDSFNASGDRIVDANYHIVETAGHALPFTHLDCCWSKLHHCLEDRISYER